MGQACLDKHQLAGLDARERGFSRPVEFEQAGEGYRAILRYESTRVETDLHPTQDEATQQVVLHRFEAERRILQSGEGNAGLFIITQGQIEVWGKGRRSEPKLLDSLDSGDYFSSLDLLETRQLDLEFKASAAWPVEALWLNPEFLNQLLDESHLAADGLQRAAQERQARYLAHLGRAAKKAWWQR